MKVIFLDVDGVLNCQTTRQRFDVVIGIDPVKVAMVKRILDATGAKIVLSSTWRRYKEYLAHVEMHLPISETTPITHARRGVEIQEVLNNPYVEGGDERVERYAILDDDGDMLDSQLPNFFQTSWETGLTDEIADKVIAHLNEEGF